MTTIERIPSLARARRTSAGVLHSEGIKLLTLRSTWWVLAATAAIMALIPLAVVNSLPPGQAEAFGITGAGIVTSGFQIGMVSIAVLGALLITAEYSTGSIRSTLAAIPTRLPALMAKATAVSVLTVLVAVVGFGAAFAATRGELQSLGMMPDFGSAQTWQAIAGTTYCLVSAVLFSLAIGTIVRSTAGAVTTALAVLLVLPTTLSFVNLDWVQTTVDYLPLPASGAFLTTGIDDGATQGLSASAGLIVVGAWALIPLVAAAITLRRRDA